MNSLLNFSGGELFRIFFEKIISLDFPALNVTFQILFQDEIFSQSLFICAEVSDGSVPLARSVVSSAKINISLSMSATISFMYIRKRSGPNLEPWGTPALVSSRLDVTQSTTTHCFLFDR